MIVKCMFLLFIPILSIAQNNGHKNQFEKLINDSTLGVPVRLPELKRGELYNFFEIGKKSTYGYLIKSDTLYYKIFSAYPKDSLPAIDFLKEELLLRIYCMQCLISCHQENGFDYPCHRNACMYTMKWYKRGRKED